MSGPDFRHMPIAGLSHERVRVLIIGQRSNLDHVRKSTIKAVRNNVISRDSAATKVAHAEAVLDLLMALEQEFPSHD